MWVGVPYLGGGPVFGWGSHIAPPPPQYLDSVRPLLDPERFGAMEALAQEFRQQAAPKLQRALILKSWWSSNYVRGGGSGGEGGGSGGEVGRKWGGGERK